MVACLVSASYSCHAHVTDYHNMRYGSSNLYVIECSNCSNARNTSHRGANPVVEAGHSMTVASCKAGRTQVMVHGIWYMA